MTMETFAPLMFAGLIIVLLIGFPVSFSLTALGLGSSFIQILRCSRIDMSKYLWVAGCY